MIKFKNDHIFAYQDVVALKVDLSTYEKDNFEINQKYVL